MNCLKSLREKAGLTQVEAAERLETTQQSVAQWESGEVRIPSDKLNMLRLLYKCSYGELLGRPRQPVVRRIQMFPGEHKDLVLSIPAYPQAFVHPLDDESNAELHHTIQAVMGANVDRELQWVGVQTLSQRLLLFRPLAMRHIWNRESDVGYPEGTNNPFEADVLNPERLELLSEYVKNHRGDEDNTELFEEAGCTEEDMLDNMKDMGVTFEDWDDKMVKTTVYFTDGRIERYHPDADTLDDLVYPITDDAIEEGRPMLRLAENDECDELEGIVFLNARHIAMIDIPLSSYRWSQENMDHAKKDDEAFERVLAFFPKGDEKPAKKATRAKPKRARPPTKKA